MLWWEAWQNIFGPASEDPVSYWRPELGLCSIPPDQVGLLTPAQMDAAYRVGRRMIRG